MIRTMNTTVTVLLELTEDEATWLHQVMQNPIGGGRPSEEVFTDRQMREAFYAATVLPL